MRKNHRYHKNTVAAVAAASVIAVGFTPAFAQQKGQDAEHQRANENKLLTADSLKGTRVVDQNNRELGTISNIFVDSVTGKIQRADIDFNSESVGVDRKYSVSWDKISINRNGDDLVATLDRSVVDRLRTAEQRSDEHNPYNLYQGDRERNERVSAADLSADGISRIQQKLNKQGFDAGHVNGQWNQDTQTALRNFQQSKGLQTTGTLDKQTINELGLDLDELHARQSDTNTGVMGQANSSMKR